MFGTVAQLSARRHSGHLVPRRLHQASLTSSLLFLGLAAWSQRHTSVPAAVAHGAAFVALATLPYTSAGQPNHVGVASAASLLHGVGVCTARANHR